MADDSFEVRYTGPGPEALEEGGKAVRIGDTTNVDEHRAASLVDSGSWEVVGKRKPRPAPAGEVAEFVVPAGDVHEQQVPAEPPPGGSEEG